MAEPLWKPTREQIERSNLKAFIQFVEQSYGLSPLSSFDELYRWPTDHIEDFCLNRSAAALGGSYTNSWAIE